MGKLAVSVTLDERNLLWLRGRAASLGRGRLSDAIDTLISEARAGRLGPPATPRSVVGTVDIAEDDPHLDRADAAIRDLFARSMAKALVAKEPRVSSKRSPATRKRRG
jgi:hypothetical protein